MTRQAFAPTAIDLSRLPAPDAISRSSFEELLSDFIARFLAFWNESRVKDPSLPAYNVDGQAYDPAIVLGRAWSYLRLLDRQRVNDVFRSLLAALATGGNLDQIAATRNLARLIVVPADGAVAAVMESDPALLRRYLMSFDRPSAGSPDGILFEAWTAWPAMHDARVNGYAVHGRRGDRDLVIIGPEGRTATADEKATVRAAVTAPRVTPEAYGLSVLDAVRVEYDFVAVIELPPGPDANLVVNEAIARVRAIARERLLTGGEIPAGLLSGAAYGPAIIRVRDLAPVVIEADPYAIPVLRNITVSAEVRS